MKKNLIFVILAALLIFPSLIFHYDLHIQDVLLQHPAEHFGVNISLLRIIIEPFVGLWLFFLRADQPMLEMVMLLIWIFAATLPLFLFSQIKINGLAGKSLLIGFSRWLSRLPIIIICWIALMMIIIFAPLPSNTIINNDPDAVLVNTHSHSEWSHDGLISQKALMRWHERNGFDAFFITDHNTHTHSLKAVKQQRDGKLASRPLIIAGEEYSGTNHIALLGLKRDFKTRGSADSTVIDSAQANNGVAIIAHWFDGERNSIQYYIDQGADGFEIVNQAEGLQYDRRVFNNIVEHCRRDSLLMTGVCDYHGYGSAALAWNAFHIPEHASMSPKALKEAIMTILHHHEQEKINVLMYRDRPLLSRELVFWSPAFNIVNYLRTLNGAQIISWFVWLFALWIFITQKQHIAPNLTGTHVWPMCGMVASLIVLAKGVHLFSKSLVVAGYNDIYSEMGAQLILIGSGFLLYSLFFILAYLWMERKTTSSA